LKPVCFDTVNLKYTYYGIKVTIEQFKLFLLRFRENSEKVLEDQIYLYKPTTIQSVQFDKSYIHANSLKPL